MVHVKRRAGGHRVPGLGRLNATKSHTVGGVRQRLGESVPPRDVVSRSSRLVVVLLGLSARADCERRARRGMGGLRGRAATPGIGSSPQPCARLLREDGPPALAEFHSPNQGDSNVRSSHDPRSESRSRLGQPMTSIAVFVVICVSCVCAVGPVPIAAKLITGLVFLRVTPARRVRPVMNGRSPTLARITNAAWRPFTPPRGPEPRILAQLRGGCLLVTGRTEVPTAHREKSCRGFAASRAREGAPHAKSSRAGQR